MIFIISDKNDIQIYYVIYYLKKKGAKYFQFNVSEYPIQIEYTYSYNKLVLKTYIKINDKYLDCDEINSVWYRKPDLPQLSPVLSSSEKIYAKNECAQHLSGLYYLLDEKFWMNRIDSMRRADNKAFALTKAFNLGLTVPKTLITNNSNKAWSFHKENKGNIIYKTLSDGLLFNRDPNYNQPFVQGEIYTTHLNQFRESDFKYVNNCPCLFQEYINKRLELRIIVVGNEVFAVEIHSQEKEQTKYDYRRTELKEITHKVHQLPQDISEKCKLLVKKLGLSYGAIDMILTPDGEYVFLEINSNGQYGWLEERTGLKINESIANSLIHANITY